MKIGFFCVFRRDPQHYEHARLMLESARRCMPGVEVVHLSDSTSPQVRGTDSMVRLPNGPMLERRLEHYAACEGEWLLVDTDTLFRGDARRVFQWTGFDVCLCDRKWPHGDAGVDDKKMPFNTGVVFSRSTAFWLDVLDVWRADESHDWLSEQRAVAAVWRTHKFRTVVLPGAIYNYPPVMDGRDQQYRAEALILHCKGPRKALMPQLAREEPLCVSH